MLHVPLGANSFAAIQSNNSGRPASAQGTSVTPAVGSKGAWAQVIAALSEDSFGLLICINSNTANAASRNSVLDIGIGDAGSEVVLIPNLIAGNAVTYVTSAGGLWYYFPVFIPAGTRIAIRAQGTVATAFSCFVQALQKPQNQAMLKSVSHVEAIGTGTLPQGSAVTAGTVSEGAWTLLGTTARDCWYWEIGLQVTSADTSHVAGLYHVDLAVGDGTNFDVILDSVVFGITANENATKVPLMVGCERLVPAGSSIYARAQFTATPDAIFITAYGAGG